MSADIFLIVVQQYLQPPERFDDFLRLLLDRHQLDIFQTRQRLLGRSLARLVQGPRDKMEEVSATLTEAGCVHWLIPPEKISFAPQRIYGLEASKKSVTFACRKQPVTFPGGGTVLAVLADISGKLAEKLMGRMLASNAYRGRAAVRHEDQQQIVTMILQGQPVLDFYQLDEDKKITAAVRVFPGRFNPQGLGNDATLSSRKNLEAMLTLMKEGAAAFQLHTDLGLAMLPGCQLRRADKNDQEALKHNLNCLTRYGWLMAALWRQGSLPRATDKDTGEAVDPGLPGLLLTTPLLAAGELSEEEKTRLPLNEEIAAALKGEGTRPAADKKATGQQQESAATLPSPPPTAAATGWSQRRIWSATVFAAVFLGFVVLLLADRSDLIDQMAYHSVASGAVPAILAVVCFWCGFYHLRIKRKIENTATSRIRSVAMGMVEIKGRATRKYALVAPMSHTPCVFYRLTRYRKDKNDRWRVISVTASENVSFFVEDKTGRVEINPARGRIRAGTRQEGFPGQIGLTRFDSDRSEKWREETIVEGTLLYVLGFAAVRQEQGETVRQQVQRAVRQLKSDKQRLEKFDLDGDGTISVDEWDAARSQMEKDVLHERMSQHNQRRRRQEEHIVIGRQKGRPLIIAETHSETHLTGTYRNKAVGLLLLSTMLTGVSIYLLINYWVVL
ncbi:MAG: hypothetical protein R6V33_05590 [Pelovirga sp.]